ncbi:hypothetical protein LA080_014487 [Diaporthe eres]|nr:hypothetical protein LA080_014487 [Diaporthe eres]
MSNQCAPTHQLAVREVFDRLTDRQKLYAHHLAQAAWYGARIIMRQVSPESNGIFDLIIELYRSCSGRWATFVDQGCVSEEELSAFLDYAALFLSNLGNYFTLEAHGIELENTRVQKTVEGERRTLHVLQASTIIGVIHEWENVDGHGTIIRVEGGDHSEELSKICASLLTAKEYSDNNTQAQTIDKYVDSFRSGSLLAYRDSQKLWVTDKSPAVETFIGFVEPYRDPHGVRGEWQGIVCISDPIESLQLKELVDSSDSFICLLPWAVPGLNGGKGPFEKDLFHPPDFANVHALASCSSIVWNGINLPNYNDVRETCGSKNVVIANRMIAENDATSLCYYVPASHKNRFRECIYSIKTITTAVHELFGHGTGKLLSETSPGKYNFDQQNAPLSPLTGDTIKTWYLPGQTWTSVFGEIAGSVEECRAEVLSLYLMDSKELLSVFGYDDTTSITAEELYYYTYLHLGVQGLQALGFYNAEEETWGEPHRQAQFSILKHVLADGGGVLSINHNKDESHLVVAVNQSKLFSHGKPCLGLRLAMSKEAPQPRDTAAKYNWAAPTKN